MSIINITFINLTTNTIHTISIPGAGDKSAHQNYLAARGQLLNPLFQVTSCDWVA